MALHNLSLELEMYTTITLCNILVVWFLFEFVFPIVLFWSCLLCFCCKTGPLFGGDVFLYKQSRDTELLSGAGSGGKKKGAGKLYQRTFPQIFEVT